MLANLSRRLRRFCRGRLDRRGSCCGLLRSCGGLARARELRLRAFALLAYCLRSVCRPRFGKLSLQSGALCISRSSSLVSCRGLDEGTLVFVARLMRAAWRTCHTEPQQLAIGGSDLVVPAPWPRVYRRGGGEVRLRCGGLSGGGELGSGCGALGGGHGGEFGGGGGGIGGGVGGLGIGLVFHCGRLAAARGLPVCARHGSWHQRLSTRLAAA
mmetsp:Transcript_31428/g.78558  ORF Transcript_31428/g.78558 Transcript_31428/m.78558 type:complete len:213 (-) Transcript_31428:479-1117(-)